MSAENHPSQENPRVGRYVRNAMRHEVMATAWMLRREWTTWLLLLAALAVLAYLVLPLPPDTLRIAKGQPNSGIAAMAERYAAELAKEGIRVEYVDSRGAPDNLDLVSEGKADVGFSQAGLPVVKEVESLGSVAYQPLWLFHRATVTPGTTLGTALQGKRVAIGTPGSGTHRMVSRLLAHLSPEIRSSLQTLELSNADMLQAMQSGAVDAAFLSTSYQSGHVQALLRDPAVQLWKFANMEGYARLDPNEHPVVMQAGSAALEPPLPAQDVHMAASTMTLVVRPELHSATKYLLLDISQRLAGDELDPFTEAEDFPALAKDGLEHGKVARRYYDNGLPMAWNYLPYWLATLIDSAWLGLLALVGLLFPIIKSLPNNRSLYYSALESDRYHDLLELEADLSHARSRAELLALLKRVHALQARLRSMWLPSGKKQPFGTLLTATMELESKIRQALSR